MLQGQLHNENDDDIDEEEEEDEDQAMDLDSDMVILEIIRSIKSNRYNIQELLPVAYSTRLFVLVAGK